MQLNNKQITQNNLSILFHKDGFSFCTHNQHHFLPLEENPPTAESLKSYLDYHQLNQKEVQLIFMDQAAVCVPKPMFDPAQTQNYLNGAIALSKKASINHIALPSLDMEVVYPCDQQVIDLFKGAFPQLNVTHLSAALLPPLSDFSFGAAKKNLFLHLRKNHFDLLLFQGGQLLVQNTFPHKNADDFLYYLFYVTEQFFLKPEQFNLFFLGRYPNFDEYYQGVEEFHPSIEYLDPQYPTIDALHPAPFLQSFYPL